MHEFETGKGKWNHLRICWDEDHDEIVLKDDLGYIRFPDDDFDEFFEGVQRIKDKLDSRKFGFDTDQGE